MNNRNIAPWIVRFAKIGFAAKAAVYLVIGGLALAAAFGSGGSASADSKMAIQTIGQQPLGVFLLVVLGVGLLCYAAWRVIAAVIDTEGKGKHGKGIASRIGYFVSGLVYGSLGLYAFSLVGLGGGSPAAGASGGESSAEDWTAKLMSQPFGKWLVATAGVILLGVAVCQFIEAIKERYKSKFLIHDLDQNAVKAIDRAAKIGLIARGVVFAVMGGALALAGIRVNPDEAKGLGEALHTLREQSYGPWLLGAVAVGLFAYGIYCAVRARYGTIGAAVPS